MTKREIVVRLCEAYIRADCTVNVADVINIADYIIQNTPEQDYSVMYETTSNDMHVPMPNIIDSTVTCAVAPDL